MVNVRVDLIFRLFAIESVGMLASGLERYYSADDCLLL